VQRALNNVSETFPRFLHHKRVEGFGSRIRLHNLTFIFVEMPLFENKLNLVSPVSDKHRKPEHTYAQAFILNKSLASPKYLMNYINAGIYTVHY